MYANAERLLQAAFMMQATRLGVSLQEFQAEFGIGRRTAGRVRDAVMRVFPQAEEVPSGEALKRWQIPASVLIGLVTFEADELSELDSNCTAAVRERAGTLHDGCYTKTPQHNSYRHARKLQSAIQRQPPPDGV